MRKVLLFLLVFSICLPGIGQVRPVLPKSVSNKSVLKKYVKPDDRNPVTYSSNYVPTAFKEAAMLYNEAEIADTKYDFPTNSMLGNRLWAWEDGTLAAVLTWGMLDPNFPDRGTGYNFFNGSDWLPKPTARIESVRCGWPNIAPWGEGEIIVSHNGETGLEISTRPVKGTGAWTETLYQGPPAIQNDPTWPRMTTTGDNHDIIHMFYNSYVAYEGQTTALLYSRSNDGGATWSPQDVILDGIGSDYYTEIGADQYVLASQGNMVVLLCADMFADMFIMKSTDNGDTWEKTIIWECPYPFFDINTTFTTDTLWTVDNSADVAIDPNGMCHVTWGVGRVARLEGTQPGYYNFWPITDGIGYWNESMGQIPEADNPHHTMRPDNLEPLGMLIGWAQDMDNNGIVDLNPDMVMVYRELGISTMPTISIDADGVIAVVYASINEDADNTINYYKRLWARVSPDLGTTWGDFFNLSEDIIHIFDECVYPVLAKNSPDNKFHLIYQADNWPGVYMYPGGAQHDPVINKVYYMSLEKGDIVGVKDPEHLDESGFTVSQNSPNPSTGITEISVDLSVPMSVTLTVCNLAGQRVKEVTKTSMGSGKGKIELNTSDLVPGVYFYTVKAGETAITKKMVVQ